MGEREAGGSVAGWLRSRLETATNIAVLIAAIAVGGYFVHLYFFSPDQQKAPSYQSGLRISLPESYDFAEHERSLILALRTDCSHCEADLPFYSDLVRVSGNEPCDVGILAVFPNDEPTVEAFKEDNDFPIRAVPEVSLTTIGVSGTPTILLVDREGVVMEAWVGELTPEREQELMTAVEPLSVCSGSDS